MNAVARTFIILTLTTAALTLTTAPAALASPALANHPSLGQMEEVYQLSGQLSTHATAAYDEGERFIGGGCRGDRD